MKIWCVEDDAGTREIEVYTLLQAGFEAEGFPDGDALRKALEKTQPDLVLLDVLLPGQDGVELLKGLRMDRRTGELPVIMTSARGTEYDQVQSLDLGADDYLVKPFGMMEMVSRVKSVLRRSRRGDASDHRLRAGGIVLNLEEHSVLINHEPVSLTLKEYEMLKLLLSHLGTAFRREQLFSEVWGEDYIGTSRTVDVHIRTLRQKLGPYGTWIKTIRGVGYRMEAGT